jgi:hypothetical protein
MKKEFVPYSLAIRMKRLGFSEPCFGYYDGNYIFCYMFEGKPDVFSNRKFRLGHSVGWISAPLFSQAFRWFRENYNLVHEISWSKYKGGLNFDYDVFSLVLPTDDELGDEDDIASDKSMETYDSLIDKDFRHKESDTYEEAELACLTKLIEIVEQSKSQ